MVKGDGDSFAVVNAETLRAARLRSFARALRWIAFAASSEFQRIDMAREVVCELESDWHSAEMARAHNVARAEHAMSLCLRISEGDTSIAFDKGAIDAIQGAIRAMFRAFGSDTRRTELFGVIIPLVVKHYQAQGRDARLVFVREERGQVSVRDERGAIVSVREKRACSAFTPTGPVVEVSPRIRGISAVDVAAVMMGGVVYVMPPYDKVRPEVARINVRF